MSTSLRDQLVKAGLVSEKQAQQAERQQRATQRGKSGPKPEPKPAAAQQAQAAKAARDLALNRQQQEKAERKARLAQLEQIIEQNRLPKVESDDVYSFVDDKKIRRIRVDASLRARLISGELAIVRYKQHYEVVPADIAARVGERDPRSVILHNTGPAAVDQPAPVDPNDPYKDAVIPDDLMW
jgi:uncharacterized protein YaiL (DUF2058 family)